MSLSSVAPQETVVVSDNQSVEISIRGKWVKVSALAVGDNAIIVKGKWIKSAVVYEEEWLDREIQAPETCVRRLKAQHSSGLRADIFTFTQKLPAKHPKYEFPMEWESVAAIPLTGFREWWERLPQESRKNVRRAEKRGVVVSVRKLDDSLIEGIIGVNNDSPIRQNLPFAHYGKSFEQVKKDQSSFKDRSDFICAYVGNELIGFMKIVYRGEIASILQLLPKASHSDKRPANALLAKAVEVCTAKKLSYLTYGMYNYGNKRDSSLKDFKIRNGFQEILVPRYYVPLTKWGNLCMLARCHRGLHGILPPRVIKTVVNARAKWYSWSGFRSRCSLTPERPNCNRQMECSNPPAGSNP